MAKAPAKKTSETVKAAAPKKHRNSKLSLLQDKDAIETACINALAKLNRTEY